MPIEEGARFDVKVSQVVDCRVSTARKPNCGAARALSQQGQLPVTADVFKDVGIMPRHTPHRRDLPAAAIAIEAGRRTGRVLSRADPAPEVIVVKRTPTQRWGTAW